MPHQPEPHDEPRVAYDHLMCETKSRLKVQYPLTAADNVDDAVSEAMMQYWLRVRRGDPPHQPYAWCLTVAVRALQREYNRRCRLRDIDDVDEPPAPERADRTMEVLMVRRLLDEVGGTYAEVLWLHEVQDCPPREIAVMLGIPVGTVYTRIKRGRKKLRILLARELRISVEFGT